MENIVSVIMDVEKDTRMKTNKPKIIHKIYGKELVNRVIDTVKKVGSDEIIVVVEYRKESVMKVIGDRAKFVVQEELLESDDALMQIVPYLEGKRGKVLLLYGNVPLIREETLRALIKRSEDNSEYATIITAIYDNPTGYGRVIRDLDGRVTEIVEEKDATDEQRKIKEIDSRIYCFDIEELLFAIKKIKSNNNQGEYYLTDVIKIMSEKGLKTGALIVKDNTEILGVNDRIELELLTRVLRMRINMEHMRAGVTIEDSNCTYIYDGVKIGKDTVIHPNTTIKSGVVIGENCEIGPNAYIREGCVIEDNAKIGSFVEIKKSKVGKGSKIPHLSYIGDCEIGKNVNIGCGTITCNYDGAEKHKTKIGDDSFIGSNVNLVAPVNIGKNVVIAAGSTITEDVPDNTLSIARERQINKENWSLEHKKTKKRKIKIRSIRKNN